MTISNRINLYHFYNLRITAALAAACALAALLYGTFLLLAVEHAAGLSRNERAIAVLTSDLGGLEREYLTKTASLTPQRAAQLGFVKPSQSAVTIAQANAPTLTLRTE